MKATFDNFCIFTFDTDTCILTMYGLMPDGERRFISDMHLSKENDELSLSSTIGLWALASMTGIRDALYAMEENHDD